MNQNLDVIRRDSTFLTLGWQPALGRQVQSFGEWKDFVRANFPWVEFRDKSAGNFSAEISSHRVGVAELSMIRASAGEVTRTRHLSEMSSAGFIKLIWQLDGYLDLEQDNRACALEPGRATVCDTSRPYRIEISEGAKFAVLMLPHSACAGWEHISQVICATEFARCASVRSVLGTMMALTAADRDEAEDGVDAVVQAVHLMITKMLHRSAEEQGARSFENPRLSRVRAHIMKNLANSDFGPDELAAAMCMSRRSLYMLFQDCDTTPVRLIRDIRLEAAMRALVDYNQKHRKITDIAFDSGFSDYATFSRLFKSQYGKTPSEFRGSACGAKGENEL